MSPGISTPSRRGILRNVQVQVQGAAWAGSALTLFVTGVFANDADDVFAFHDLAILAQAFD